MFFHSHRWSRLILYFTRPSKSLEDERKPDKYFLFGINIQQSPWVKDPILWSLDVLISPPAPPSLHQHHHRQKCKQQLQQQLHQLQLLQWWKQCQQLKQLEQQLQQQQQYKLPNYYLLLKKDDFLWTKTKNCTKKQFKVKNVAFASFVKNKIMYSCIMTKLAWWPYEWAVQIKHY